MQAKQNATIFYVNRAAVLECHSQTWSPLVGPALCKNKSQQQFIINMVLLSTDLGPPQRTCDVKASGKTSRKKLERIDWELQPFLLAVIACRDR